MLCSIPTGKSTSSWLDRLRSSKGFPSCDNLDLDQFLSLQSHEPTNSSDAKQPSSHIISSVPSHPPKQPSSCLNETAETSTRDSITNVLCDLFCMGEPRQGSCKKGSRKQPNPRIRVSGGKKNRDLAVGDGDSEIGIKGSGNSVKVLELGEDVNVGEEDEGKRDLNLPGFSRTEVTVIDTSCAPWKFDKLLLRKKNVWKVRDKKCRAMNFSKKKRKASEVDILIGREKKQKVSASQCGVAEEGNGREQRLLLTEGYHNSSTSEETGKRTLENTGQVHEEKRSEMPSEKLKHTSSTIILIKSIPTNKKNGTNISKSSTRPQQRQ